MGLVETKLHNPHFHPHKILPLHPPKNVLLLQTFGNEKMDVRVIMVEEISGYGQCLLRQAEVRIGIVMLDGKDPPGEGSHHHLRLLVEEDEIFLLEATIGRKRNRGLLCLLFLPGSLVNFLIHPHLTVCIPIGITFHKIHFSQTSPGPVFRTDDLMNLFRNAVIPSSNRSKSPPPPPPPPRSGAYSNLADDMQYTDVVLTGRPPPDYGPYQGPNSAPRRRY